MAQMLVSAAAFVVVAALACSCALAQDEVVGCDGFLHLSSRMSKSVSSKDVDFSSASIALVSSGGVVKERTEFSPNGYFFLPVYDRAARTYKLVVDAPDGWTLDPREQSVQVSAAGECAGGEDINFEVVGFKLTGSVGYAGQCMDASDAGFVGVSVSLSRTKGGVEQEVATADVRADGSFLFEGVVPARYTLSVAGDQYSFATAKHTIESFPAGALSLGRVLHLGGVSVVGHVLSGSEGEAAAGATVTMHDAAGNELQTAVSNAAGRYTFTDVPCGQFAVSAVYHAHGAAFHLEPARVPVSVGRAPATVVKPFVITGFSASGSVLSVLNGRGVAGASVAIFRRGEEGGAPAATATTDADGKYQLHSLSEGTYSVRVSKANAHFDSLPSLALTASTAAHVPDIHLTKVDVCGRVSLGVVAGEKLAVSGREVVLTSGSDVQEKPLATTTCADDGTYCFALGSGFYHVAVKTTPRERAKGLILTPVDGHDIEVKSAPVMDIDFSQATVQVRGMVKCAARCDSGIAITLASVEPHGARMVTALEEVVMQQGGASAAGLSTFQFKGVVPGEYAVTVSPSDSLCWETVEKIIELGSEDYDDLTFTQVGYRVTVSSSHDLDLELRALSSGRVYQQLAVPGMNSFCVPDAGDYVVVPSSCFYFPGDPPRLSTSVPTPIKFQADHHRVRGVITTAGEGTAGGAFQVAVSVDGEEQQVQASPVPSSPGSYEFFFIAPFGAHAVVTPSAPGGLLVYPPQRSVDLSTTSCEPDLELFSARPGRFIEGDVTPAMKGVHIEVVNEYGEVVGEKATDASGRYKIGPLYDDMQYEVQARKDGYFFSTTDDDDLVPSSFRSVRLGSAAVSVVDEESGKPVGGVLLVISGGKAYKGKGSTDGETGTVRFGRLFPGSYFVRPVLKEFAFEPSSVSFEVTEGEESSVRIAARRTAFSCFGAVRSLVGDAERGATVAAASVDDVTKSDGAIASESIVDQVQTDTDGSYRLRGLLPGVQYFVFLQSGGRVSRALPERSLVEVSAGDVRGVDFVTLRTLKKYDVVGAVDAPSAHLSSLSVHLIEPGSEVPVATHDLGTFRFFQFTDVLAGEYRLEVHTTLPKRLYEFRAPTKHVSLEGAEHEVVVRLAAAIEPRVVAQEISQGSVVPLLLLLIGSLCWYYQTQILTYAKELRYGKPKKRATTGNEGFIDHITKPKKR